jgi:hypothetical protein
MALPLLLQLLPLLPPLLLHIAKVVFLWLLPLQPQLLPLLLLVRLFVLLLSLLPVVRPRVAWFQAIMAVTVCAGL